MIHLRYISIKQMFNGSVPVFIQCRIIETTVNLGTGDIQSA